MIYKEIVVLGLLCIVIADTNKQRSLFDDLIVDNKAGSDKSISLHDASKNNSKCINSSSCPQAKTVNSPSVKSSSSSIASSFSSSLNSPSSSRSSLFDTPPKQRSSLTSKLVKQSRTHQHRSRPSFSQDRTNKDKTKSLLDAYVSNTGRSSQSYPSLQNIHQPSSFYTSEEYYQHSIDTLRKERQAIENLPNSIWQETLQKTKTKKEKQFYDHLLNLVGDYAKNMKSLYPGQQNRENNVKESTFNNFQEKYNSQISPQINFEDNFKAISKLLSQNSKHFESSLSEHEREYLNFIEDIKKSRTQDLLLALKIMKVMSNTTKEDSKKEEEETELLLAKSLIKRSIGSLEELSPLERNSIHSVIRVMHGDLNKNEKEQVMNSASSILTFPGDDFEIDSFEQRDYILPNKKFKPQPIGPPSPTTTRPTTIVGPPSPPRPPPVGPPSPPSLQQPNAQPQNFFITEENSDELFFISDNNAKLRAASNPTKLNMLSSTSQADVSNNVFGPINASPENSIETENSIKFHRLITASDSSRSNIGTSNQNQASNLQNPQNNFHYDYFTPAGSLNSNTKSKDVSSERAFIMPNTKSSNQFTPSFSNNPIGQSSYSSLSARAPLRTANNQARPAQNFNSQLQFQKGGRNTQQRPFQNPQPQFQQNYGAPQFTIPSAPSTYGFPPANPPQQTYGAPQRNPPQMSYGAPPAPRNPPQNPIRTRVVFLKPNKKGKGKKKNKGGFSAFSVLFGGASDSGLRDPGFQNVDGYSRRNSLQDEFWRSRQQLFRFQQETFELERLRADIKMQEKQREKMKRGLFKRLFTDDLSDDIGGNLFKGAVAIGALSLFPLYNMFG